MTDVLRELADRVEAATEPSRELDAQIAIKLELAPEGFVLWDVPRFTASIDAALTLLPDGLGRGSFFLQRNQLGSSHATVWYNTEFNLYRDGDGATPALALTAASLRARSAS